MIARLAPRLTSLARWRPWRGRKAGGSGNHADADSPQDPLLECGRRLRDGRERRSLSLRQLALETRISTPVLEALERGWRDRLPEATYLRTMLPLLEQRLDLPRGSLNAALPAQAPGGGASSSSQNGSGGLRRFTPGSIDVFSSWQGTLLYGGLVLGLLYGINLQQQRLAAANLLTMRPIAPPPPPVQNRPTSPGQTLLRLHPDLRPLQLAGRGTAMAALQRSNAAQANRAAVSGLLQLNLIQPSRVSLSSPDGTRTDLRGTQGTLVLDLTPPLQLTITPAPGTGGDEGPEAVLWNGLPLAPLPRQPGRYRLP